MQAFFAEVNVLKNIIHRLFSISIYDYSIIIYFCGIKITSSQLYNLFFGDPLITNCSILQDINELKANGTKFPHPVGIVIAPEVQIGKNCTILQNVTIGTGGSLSGESAGKYPVIGDNVQILAGAVIVGDVKIGDNAVIAANSVVRNDVEPNSLVAGVPAVCKKKY